MENIYKKLENKTLSKIEENKHIASQKYTVTEDYYLDQYKDTIKRAQSFNIWSF